MKAIEFDAARQQATLTSANTPIPVPADGEILIRVIAAGVNRADLFQMKGLYPPPEGASPIPGLEVSGTVESAGNHFRKGDRVMALLSGGGYAEYCVVPEGQVMAIPENLSYAQAAALPEALATCWLALVEKLRVQAGERVLIHGGASGIGAMAIQIVKWLGAEAWVTAGTKEKCDACLRLGAKRAIHYREEDFAEAIKAETHGQGVHAIIDMVGGDYVQKNLSALAVGGRIVSLAFLRGSKVEVNLAPLLFKQAVMTGFTLRAQPAGKKAEIVRNLQKELLPEVAVGRLMPLIDSEFPLGDVEKALKRMENNLNIGKILLLCADSEI